MLWRARLFSTELRKIALQLVALCTLSNGSHDKFRLEFNARSLFVSPENWPFVLAGRTLYPFASTLVWAARTLELKWVINCHKPLTSVEAAALSSHSPSLLGEGRVKAPERTDLLARRLLVPSQTEWVRTWGCCSESSHPHSFLCRAWELLLCVTWLLISNNSLPKLCFPVKSLQAYLYRGRSFFLMCAIAFNCVIWKTEMIASSLCAQ